MSPVTASNTDVPRSGCLITKNTGSNNEIKGTKIYFKSPELKDISIGEELKKKFLNRNIKPDRLIVEKSSDYKTYLKAYSKVHITLDPFPWNGATTSFESIWMGVPIFCLEGNNLVYSRCAYSINKNLKMDDWIAKDYEDYLIKAEAIAKIDAELAEIARQEESIIDAEQKIEVRRAELSKQIDELHSRITTNTKEIMTAAVEQHTKQNKEIQKMRDELISRVGVLEKWRHVLIGGSIVIGFMLHKFVNFGS